MTPPPPTATTVTASALSPTATPGEQATTYGPLTIRYDATVLRPREWTVAQGAWAQRLLPYLPDGPVLELCTGAGHIGLLAVHGSGRRLVAVDVSADAVRWTRRNAAANGVDAEVREAPLSVALAPGERFPLVVADPPWVPRAEVGAHPDDPLLAIDGGDDGLDVARECIAIAGDHLLPDGVLLVQVGTEQQVAHLRPAADAAGFTELGRYVRPGRGVVLGLVRAGTARR